VSPSVCWRQIDRTARILIADADPLEAEFLRRQLHSAGYRFFSTTSDCRGTLLKMREEQPDVVLLDASLQVTEVWTCCGSLVWIPCCSTFRFC
jgi:DNA-binding response OmpR family regulator